jgi:hypothetical protein
MNEGSVSDEGMTSPPPEEEQQKSPEETNPKDIT